MPPAPIDTTADPRLDRAKRRQILDGASHMFLTQGFDAASMGAIAQQAGVSKGTLYVYFKSKEDLFGAIIEDQRLRHAAQIFTFDDASDDIEAVLTKLGTEFVAFLTKPGVLQSLRTVIAISERMPTMGEHFYQTGPAVGIAKLKNYLETQVAAGVLAPHDCATAAAQFIDSCTSLIFKPMLFNATAVPDAALARRVVSMAVQTYVRAWRL